MRKGGVEIVDHRLDALVTGMFDKHALVAVANARAHLALAHGPAEVFGILGQLPAYAGQDALE